MDKKEDLQYKIALEAMQIALDRDHPFYCFSRFNMRDPKKEFDDVNLEDSFVNKDLSSQFSVIVFKDMDRMKIIKCRYPMNNIMARIKVRHKSHLNSKPQDDLEAVIQKIERLEDFLNTQATRPKELHTKESLIDLVQEIYDIVFK